MKRRMTNKFGEVESAIVVSDSVEIHVKKDMEFNGKKMVDIRKYIKTSAYTGYSKDGVTMPENPVVLRQVAEALLFRARKLEAEKSGN